MMKVKKIPLRTCVVTKENLPKKELLRIVRTPEGEIKVDETGKLNGRGAYIKKDLSVLEQAQKSKILEKRLECKIEDSVYENIKKIIEK
ncbi:MAG: YlxR family protein [Bacilli bacterium]|nr:YlxR family protein [Bacilli bacterium]